MLCLASVGAPALTVEQQAFVDQLNRGDYFFPINEAGPLAGQLTIYDDTGQVGGQVDGFWRSLLKGVGVASATVAGGAGGFLVGGPVGAGVGAAAGGGGYKTFVDSLNASGPPPGKQWLISDARIYNSVDVAGVNLLPQIVAFGSQHVSGVGQLFDGASISFLDLTAGVFPRVLDANFKTIGTVSSAELFLLQSAGGTTFGSLVETTIGFPGSRPLTPTDYLDIELSSLLTAPAGTSIAFSSTLVVGVTAVPEPSTWISLATGLLAFLARRISRRARPASA
jgi:PEP-CTERM motif